MMNPINVMAIFLVLIGILAFCCGYCFGGANAYRNAKKIMRELRK